MQETINLIETIEEDKFSDAEKYFNSAIARVLTEKLEDKKKEVAVQFMHKDEEDDSEHDEDVENENENSKLTSEELRKREEIAQAIEQENPGIEMSQKMAMATAQVLKMRGTKES